MTQASPSLATRRLGKTDLQVSVLGFGAAPAAFLRTERDAAATVIHDLLDRGVNLIDTATSYPGSHEFIGEYLSGRRGDYVLVSKVGSTPKGPKWDPTDLKAQVDAALTSMRTDHVDVMLLHSCDMAVLEADEALGALVECREAGKVRYVGYSGDNEEAAFACRLPDIAVLETSVNIADQHNIDAVLPLAQKYDVGVIAKRPIANAAWKDLASQPGFYKSYAKTYTERLGQMGLRPADVGMTEADWPELALRFTLAQPGVTTAIVGTTRRENALRNLDLAARGPLPESAVETIRAKFRNATGAEAWTGQK